MMTPKMPAGMLDAFKMLPMLDRLRDLMPKTVKDAPCQEVVKRDGSLDELPILKTWPEDGGRYITLPLVITKDPETGVRNIGTYRMQVFDGRTTGMHWQRHKGRRAASSRRRAYGKAARGGGGAEPGADPRLCGDCADARRARRAAARRLSQPPAHRAREGRHRRSRSAGERAHRARRLRRAWRAAARGAVRRPHGLLLARRGFSGLPPHVHHDAEEADVPDDSRRHSTAGGRVPRQGQRADLSSDDSQDDSGNRGHALSAGGHLPQHRAGVDRQAVSRATRARS